MLGGASVRRVRTPESGENGSTTIIERVITTIVTNENGNLDGGGGGVGARAGKSSDGRIPVVRPTSACSSNITSVINKPDG